MGELMEGAMQQAPQPGGRSFGIGHLPGALAQQERYQKHSIL
jgi:hypothetical protein